MDCCHSATMLDLKYRYISGKKSVIEKNIKSNQNVNIIMLSGCKDNQTSDDAYYNNNWTGAMTKFFLKTMNLHNYNITCFNLLRKMRNSLKNNGHSQIPQITSNKKINSITLFSSNDKTSKSFLYH